MPRPQPRVGILEIEPYVGGKASAGNAGPTIKLSANEGALGPSPAAVAALRACAAEAHRYPDGNSVELREAIGARFALDPERIVCGAGSDELLGLLGRIYAGPGDEVIHSAHGFMMYRLLTLAAGAHPVAVPESELTADVDAILKALTSRTRIVFLANPNNPTGTYLPVLELERLRAGLPDDVLLVVDAAYAEFVARPDYEPGVNLVDAHANVVMTRTFSKLFGLAAVRLGWLYGPPAVVDAINRVRNPFNVGVPAQAAGVAALADRAHQDAARAHNERWLPWLSAALREQGLTVVPSVGNFVLVRFADAVQAAAAAAHLERRGVVPRAMVGYGLADSLRLTVGLEDENRATVEALREFLA